MPISDPLDAYEELLQSWAPRLDLVAPGDLPRLRERHIDDCLRALPLITAAAPGPCVDVGSGAGLPGIVLAIADRSRLWRLIEPRARRAAFLEEAVRTLGLTCEVVTLPAEQAAADPGLARAHAVATARALAPPAKAFELLGPLVAPGGLGVVWVGKDAIVPADAGESVPGLATLRF